MKGVVIMVGLLVAMPLFGVSNSHTMPSPFWEGSVTLVENLTIEVKAISGKTYSVEQTTALGALDKASQIGGFEYTIDDSWYKQYGALLVSSIAGIKNSGMDGWQYWVNYPDEPIPMTGADKYKVKDGDVVDWFYGGYGSNPDNAKMLIRIHVNVVKDKEKPIVEIIKPRGGIYIFDREIVHFSGVSYIIGEITIEAHANDNLTGIKNVELYIDGSIKQSWNEEPYTLVWDGSIGSHVIKVVAYDKAGNMNYDTANVWTL